MSSNPKPIPAGKTRGCKGKSSAQPSSFQKQKEARSGTTADDRVRFCKNYSIDQDGLEHMDTERAEAIAEGHIVPGPLRPTGIPLMANSKGVIGVITQIKLGGRVKRRTVTDAGCVRQPRETRSKMIWDVRGSGSWWSVSNSNAGLHQLIAQDGSVFRAESTGVSHAVISHAVSRTLLSAYSHASLLTDGVRTALQSVSQHIVHQVQLYIDTFLCHYSLRSKCVCFLV
jgi:hypothetical protein